MALVQIPSLKTSITGSLLVVLLYFPQQLQSLLPTALHAVIASSRTITCLKAYFAFRCLQHLNYYLSDQVLNNWKNDAWRTGEEVVLITGGSGGMGEKMAIALSKSSKAVIILDIQPPKALRMVSIEI